MQKVLFVTERWCDGDPQRGWSNTEHNLFGSLEASGLAEYENLFVDEHVYSYGRRVDATLLNTCAIQRPSLVVISPLVGSDWNPSKETLDKIRDMNIPVVAFWWDTAYEGRVEIADDWAPHVDVGVVVDRGDFATKFPYKYIHTWVPQDTRVFNQYKTTERDLDVVFLGSSHVYNHSKRRSALDRLKSEGVKVFEGGGQRLDNLNIDQYAEYMNRAKIVINFPWTMDTYPSVVPYQMKARVFEACFCGALLVEGDNPYTPYWLKPGEDYVSYETSMANRVDYYADNPDTSLDLEMVKKVKYYLDHRDEREAIADRGCKKVQNNYNATEFWKLIFNRAGVL